MSVTDPVSRSFLYLLRQSFQILFSSVCLIVSTFTIAKYCKFPFLQVIWYFSDLAVLFFPLFEHSTFSLPNVYLYNACIFLAFLSMSSVPSHFWQISYYHLHKLGGWHFLVILKSFSPLCISYRSVTLLQ